MKQYRNFYMTTVIIIFMMIFFSLQQQIQSPLNNKIQKPFINETGVKVTILHPPQAYNITLTPPDHLYIINTQILQRSNSENINQQKSQNDLHRYFHSSKSCKIDDPNIEIKKIFQQRIMQQSSLIRQTYITQSKLSNNNNNNLTQIWILTDKFVQKYIINEFIMLAQGRASLPQEIKNSQLFKFVQINQNICLIDGYSIYAIGSNGVSEDDALNLDNMQISFWKTFVNQSMNSTSNDKQKIVKIVQLDHIANHFILLLTHNSLKIYKYLQMSFQFVQITHKEVSSKLLEFLQSKNNTVFIDIIWESVTQFNLFILTNNAGIIQIQNYNLPSYEITVHQIGQLGILVSFMKFSDVFEIVFKLSEQSPSMIAQFQFSPKYFNKTTGNLIINSSLILNRFYSKIKQVYDIDYIQGRLLILSDNQFFIYGPGVNRQLLIDQNGQLDQYPYYGVCWDINQFIPLSSKSDNYSLKLIGIGNQHLSIYQFKRPNISIHCSINQSMRVVAKIIGTCQGEQQSLMKTACSSTYIYELQVKKIDVTSNTAYWLTMVIIIFVCWLTLWNCLFLKFMSDAKNRIKRMFKILMQKKNKNEKKVKYDTVVNTQTNDLNPKLKGLQLTQLTQKDC